MKKELPIYQSKRKKVLSSPSVVHLSTMKKEEKLHINRQENKSESLWEGRRGCTKQATRHFQLGWKVKREEIESEVPQIKIKIAIR